MKIILTYTEAIEALKKYYTATIGHCHEIELQDNTLISRTTVPFGLDTLCPLGVTEAIKRDNRIEAIKIIRAVYGWSLRDSKAYIDHNFPLKSHL